LKPPPNLDKTAHLETSSPHFHMASSRIFKALLTLATAVSLLGLAGCQTVYQRPVAPPPSGAKRLDLQQRAGLARVLSLLMGNRALEKIAVNDTLTSEDMLGAARQKFLRSIGGAREEICLRVKSGDRLHASYHFDRSTAQVYPLSIACPARPVVVRVEKADPSYQADLFVEIDAGSSGLNFTVTLANGRVTYLGNSVVQPASTR
jgi:hypothetical protein